MNCILWNAQSLNNKIDGFIQTLEDNDINIGLICETWFKSRKNHITSLLNESGFKTSHFNRTDIKGGGVGIISKSCYQTKFEKCCYYSSFECVLQTLKLGSNMGNITLIVIYRHFQDNINVFLEQFYEFIEYVKLNFTHFIVAGDFNIHVNKVNDRDTIKFMDILDTFSLVQAVNCSTHKLGNTLDLVIYDPNIITVSNLIVDPVDRPGSDHYIIYFEIMCNIAVTERQQVHFRDYKNLSLPEFSTDIINKTCQYIDVANVNDFKSSLDLFNNTYGGIVDKHAPLVSKVVNVSTRPPWMDSEFVAARKERRQLYKKWKRQKNDLNRENFVQSRASVDTMSKEKRRNFYREKINSSNNSQRELFKMCNTLLDSKQQSQLPYSENYNALANDFNNYFVTKIENIRKNIKTKQSQLVSFEPTVNISTFSNFDIVTAEDLLKIIKSSKIKTNSDDPIPAFILKSSVEHLIPAYLHLINVSLQTGSMEGLKNSIVTPILKKVGLDQNILSNYRPVCGGLYIDKLIQKCVFMQLNNHMLNNNLHIPFQSGYKVHHSCETVLLRLFNDILMVLDTGSCSVVLLLDLSAAFDTVDHDELGGTLQYEIGLSGTVLDWFNSFLSDRIQSTSVKGCRSEFIHMKYGVPQGSVLGPVLFNIYIRNFISLLQEAGFMVHGYADDHQVFFAFRIQFQYNALCVTLPKLLDLISGWMNSKFLKLNAGKSNLLVFAPKHLQNQILIDKVYIGDNTFLPVSSNAMNLGFKLDSELKLDQHIGMILSQSYTMISLIGKIRRYLTVNDLRCLVQCIIISKVDNCNSIYYGISEYEINRLQKLQNSCARLIYNKKKYDHVSELFADLHWLPIKPRIVFKILLFVYKIFNNDCPVYLKDCITITDVDNRLLHVNRVKTTYGDRAFANCAPKLWNALPMYIKQSNTLSYFKKHLKHYFFNNFADFLRVVNVYRV